MSLSENIKHFNAKLKSYESKLIAVSKTYPPQLVLEAYQSGQLRFGENKVQELVSKYEILPKEIEWHLIGHLQTNKVKYIAPFVHLIHSVDSLKLLKEINKEAQKNKRVIQVLLQIFIAQEDTKFGLDFKEAEALLISTELEQLKNIRIVGFMGMASNTDDSTAVRKEFKSLKHFFDRCKAEIKSPLVDLQELSMGMSSDFEIALEEGSTMVRIGTAIFGKRV